MPVQSVTSVGPVLAVTGIVRAIRPPRARGAVTQSVGDERRERSADASCRTRSSTYRRGVAAAYAPGCGTCNRRRDEEPPRRRRVRAVAATSYATRSERALARRRCRGRRRSCRPRSVRTRQRKKRLRGAHGTGAPRARARPVCESWRPGARRSTALIVRASRRAPPSPAHGSPGAREDDNPATPRRRLAQARRRVWAPPSYDHVPAVPLRAETSGAIAAAVTGPPPCCAVPIGTGHNGVALVPPQ